MIKIFYPEKITDKTGQAGKSINIDERPEYPVDLTFRSFQVQVIDHKERVEYTAEVLKRPLEKRELIELPCIVVVYMKEKFGHRRK